MSLKKINEQMMSVQSCEIGEMSVIAEMVLRKKEGQSNYSVIVRRKVASLEFTVL